MTLGFSDCMGLLRMDEPFFFYIIFPSQLHTTVKVTMDFIVLLAMVVTATE